MIFILYLIIGAVITIASYKGNNPLQVILGITAWPMFVFWAFFISKD